MEPLPARAIQAPFPTPEQRIQAELDRIERTQRVAILFAVESGSRAWGCPSPDSDWDVRFVYAVPPRQVVTLYPPRDTIEVKAAGDLDLAGWRSDKALKLLLKGNCALREWLASPIVYRGADWVERFTRLGDSIPGRRSAFWHYRALLTSVWGRYIEDEAVFSLKRYLYVLRPALALLWLRQHGAGTPPMDFPALLDSVDFNAVARDDLMALLARKAEASEIGKGGPIPSLHALIAEVLRLTPPADPGEPSAQEYDAALALYRSSVGHAGDSMGVGWR